MGRITGVIRGPDGRPMAEMRVLVVDPGLREDRDLAEGTTDADGRYEIQYELRERPSARRRGVRVTVVDAEGNALAASDVRFNIGTDETIDVVVDAPRPQVTFARLVDDVEAATRGTGVSIQELDDGLNGPDVEYLAGRTGHTPDVIARLIRAVRISVELGRQKSVKRRRRSRSSDSGDGDSVPLDGADLTRAGVLYAILAGDPGADVSTLANREPDLLRTDVAAAAEAGIIPTSYVDSVPGVLDALASRRVGDFLEPLDDAAAPSAVAVALEAIHAPSAVRTAVADLALSYGVNESGFWDAVATDPRVPRATVEHLAGATAFLQVSGGSAELLASVVADPELGGVNAIDPGALVKLDRNEWVRRFEAAGSGDTPTTADPAATLGDVERYAATLAEAIERRYPSAKLLFELSRDTTTNPLVEHKDAIATFLGNNPDFHLHDTPIAGLLADADQRAQRLRDMAQPDETVALIGAYQRLERLLPDLATEATWDEPIEPMPRIESHYLAISRLVRDGFRSAIDVGALPLREFDARYSGTLGDPDFIAMVHRRAEMATDFSLHVALTMRDWADPIVPRALPRALTWADTFGAPESCECGHCLSITSPAAYLFDSLRFLEDAGGTQQPLSPLDVLKRRRGDLVEIVLTCDNTNTQIPYVDIVNEQLEGLVARDWFKPFDLPTAAATALTNGEVSAAVRQAFTASPNSINLSRDALAYPLRTATAPVKTWHLLDGSMLYVIRRNGAGPRVELAAFQTSGAQEDLRAAPQHRIQSAYRRLEQQVHPWTMPYSLAWNEVTEYLARLEVTPGEILDAFSGPSTPASSLISPFESVDANAGTYLGLSPVEFQIIAGQKTAGSGPIPLGGADDFPEDFWGLPRGTIQAIRDWDGSTVLASWDVAVFRVPRFLELSGLSYVELLELLGSYFLNPASSTGPGGRQLYIASRDGSNPATCELAKLEIQGIPTNGGVALATKIHRFVRLRRRLGWSVADLDRVLVALGATTMDRDALVAVSMVERLRRRTGLEIRELSGWLGAIDHDRYYDVSGDEPSPLPSFYDEVFRIPDTLEPGSPFGEDAAALSAAIGTNHIRLAARLGIPGPDLDRFRNDVRILAAADRNTLNAATLSTLSRYASFGHWASLDAEELIAAIDTCGFEPFATDSTATSIDRANRPLRFIEALDSLAEVGLRPKEARYVFADAGALDSSPALTPEEIAAALGAVVDAVRPVLAALAYPVDAGADVVATELTRLGWAESLAKEAADFFANTQLNSTPIAPADVPIALATQPRILFDEAAGTLSARGALAPAELQSLQALAGATPGFTAAVQALYDQPRTFAQTRLGTVVAPEYTVALMRMPTNVKLPRELAVALRYDANRRVLVFRGSRDLLSLVPFPSGTLNQEWTAFKAAVDALKADPLPATVVQDPSIGQNVFFANAAELDTLLGGTRTPEQRCAFALGRIAVARWRIESDAAAASALGGVAALDAAATRAARDIWNSLLTDPVSNGPSTFARNPTFSTAAASPVAAVVRRLHKLGLLLARFGLPASAGLWLIRNADAVGGPDLTQLPGRAGDPAATWNSVHALVNFARAYRGFLSADGSLLDLLDIVANPLSSHAEWASLAARIKDWDSGQVRALTGSPSFPVTFEEPQFYVRLLEKMRIAARCGVSGGTLSDWNLSLASSPGGTWTGLGLETVAAEIRSGVRSKVGRERWLQIATEVNDPLRESRRDALLTYLLARPNPWDGTRLRDADHLFDYLLIDTQMAACMPTSRIRAAMSSVQTFMQRALMNLEPEVAVLTDRAREWNTWRKQYRVWEANRKVFLYPENWLEPTLRDDKTGLFVEVENGLLQAPMSAESATKAVAEYLDGLSGLSDLEIVGAYRQRELVEGELVDEMHIVGRSRAVPREHFYRRATGGSNLRTAKWGGWSKLELDIDSDYVLPFATGTDAYVFWPVIAPVVPKAKDSGSDPLPTKMPKKLEIKLAWSRNGGRGWSAKLVSRDAMIVDRDDDREIKDAFAFSVVAAVEGAYLSVSAIRTAILGAVDPALLAPKATFGPPLGLSSAPATDDFYFIVTVSDSLGQPIRNATVVITEVSNFPPAYYVSGIVPMNYGDPPRSYSATTDANGRAIPKYLQRSWAQRWNVAATLPSSVSSEIVSPHHCARVVDTPAARADKRQQSIRVGFTFSRKPVTTQVTQSHSIGVFAVERSGNVAVSQWSPAQFAPTTFQPTNITWGENAFAEKPGADDRLMLPALPNQVVIPHTPGLFRLRPLNQPLWSMDPTYFAELGPKRYAIDLKPGASQKVPVLTPTFHPYAQDWTRALASSDESVVLRLDRQLANDAGGAFISRFMYGGVATLGPDSVPVEDVGFGAGGFYEPYNWELFYQVPLAVATQLMRNQRFADAQRWLHYVYDPTAAGATTFSPQFAWKFRPFFDAPPSTLPGLFADPANLEAQLTVLRKDPFNPWAIARLRRVALMKNVVMTYLDNLIAWGDQLFARDTMESMNEATQIYLLAHQILGPRPERVPRRARPTPQTYRSMAELASGQAPALSDIGAIAVDVSSFVPLSGTPTTAMGAPLGTMLYFCVAGNEKLLRYWDTVEDRLFKIRHCLDIGGRFRVPALFEPPIDPALLIRARAAGVDIADVLADASAPLPNYRFGILAQKATELASELKSLGASLLAALEKRDGEALAMLRQRHELSLTPLVEEIRKKQIDDADTQIEALQRSRDSAMERLYFYGRVLGGQGDGKPATVEYLPAAVQVGGAQGTTGLALSQHEVTQLGLLEEANNFALAGSVASVLAGILSALPDAIFPVKWGGSHAGSAANAVGSFFNLLATNAAYKANRQSIVGSFARRQDEWTLQHNLAVSDLRQIDRQIAGAEIRKAIAEQELTNHRQQTENSQEVEVFLKTKYTNQQLYDWHVAQLAGLYFGGYKLAHAVAKRAERAFREDLGILDSDFVQFGYWDDMRRGLLAGERLHNDVKRMEVAYLDENDREYEITKHVSLASLNPTALVELRRTGACEFVLPEWAFDLDYPGHYMRRIKHVSVTIPAVIGPYASVNCTLTMQSSSIRGMSAAAGAYPRKQQNGVPQDDARFVDRFSAAQSIVTSTGQNDTGMFETNLRDERYLPFEGQGVISRWRVELRADSNSVDPNSVRDLILHVRYTAREGGQPLANAARAAVATILKPATGASLFTLFSLRQDFPDEWHRLLSGAASKLGPLDAGRRRFPLLFSRKRLSILKERDYYLAERDGTVTPLARAATGGLEVELAAPSAADRITIDERTHRVDLTLDRTKPDTLPVDVLIVCRYKVG